MSLLAEAETTMQSIGRGGTGAASALCSILFENMKRTGIQFTTASRFKAPGGSMIRRYAKQEAAEVFGEDEVNELVEASHRVANEDLRAIRFIGKLNKILDEVASVNQMVKLWPESINIIPSEMRLRLDEKKERNTAKRAAEALSDIDAADLNTNLAIQKMRHGAGF